MEEQIMVKGLMKFDVFFKFLYFQEEGFLKGQSIKR